MCMQNMNLEVNPIVVDRIRVNLFIIHFIQGDLFNIFYKILLF